jgi:hypothetical protein
MRGVSPSCSPTTHAHHSRAGDTATFHTTSQRTVLRSDCTSMPVAMSQRITSKRPTSHATRSAVQPRCTHNIRHRSMTQQQETATSDAHSTAQPYAVSLGSRIAARLRHEPASDVYVTVPARRQQRCAALLAQQCTTRPTRTSHSHSRCQIVPRNTTLTRRNTTRHNTTQHDTTRHNTTFDTQRTRSPHADRGLQPATVTSH